MMAPAFLKLGRTYYISQRRYSGLCVASKKALFLFVNSIYNEEKRALMGAIVGGLMGGFIGRQIGRAMMNSTAPATPDYAHTLRFMKTGALPPTILQHPEWPLRHKGNGIANLPVIVIKRSEIDVITHPSYTTALKMNIGPAQISIEYPSFRGKAIRRYLHQAGWSLNWCGWDVIAIPDEAPVNQRVSASDAKRPTRAP
ncbi:MAG TPA: hypothetical protein P5081_16660 [Phycisphaerae bacterium]|nr:hypothetical protein [Phycisphaerae bacterium]HRW54503.1 hypothetical protein [Phycisphaerae bacterium]